MSVISAASPTSSGDNYRYDRIQRALHWGMAAIIIVALAIGFYCSLLVPGTPVRKGLLEIHKSLGMTALVLAALRVGYRLMQGAPAYRQPLGALTHIGASIAHAVLYALMIAMPLTGYLFSAAGGYSLPWFGLFQWPRLVPGDKALAQLGQELHGWGAWLVYAMLTAHIGAVVWHQFVKKDEVLARMLPPKS